MRSILDFFRLNDAMPILCLIGVLEFVGSQMESDEPVGRRWKRGFAGAGFLLYAACGIGTLRHTNATAFLTLALQATLAMGTAHGLARVLAPLVSLMHRKLWVEPMAEQEARRIAAELAERKAQHDREAAEQRDAERRRSEEEAQRLASLPPPPTPEERRAAARAEYESALAFLAAAGLDDIELHAARERAKQKYLCQLDGAMP